MAEFNPDKIKIQIRYIYSRNRLNHRARFHQKNNLISGITYTLIKFNIKLSIFGPTEGYLSTRHVC